MQPPGAAPSVARMDAHDADTIAPVIAAFAPTESSRDPVEFGVAASSVTGAPLIVVHVHRGGPLVSWFGGDTSDFRTEYSPGHPSADPRGYVKLPNVDPLIEAMDMREAQRAYEANLSVIETARAMDASTLELLKK